MRDQREEIAAGGKLLLGTPRGGKRGHGDENRSIPRIIELFSESLAIISKGTIAHNRSVAGAFSGALYP